MHAKYRQLAGHKTGPCSVGKVGFGLTSPRKEGPSSKEILQRRKARSLYERSLQHRYGRVLRAPVLGKGAL